MNSIAEPGVLMSYQKATQILKGKAEGEVQVTRAEELRGGGNDNCITYRETLDIGRQRGRHLEKSLKTKGPSRTPLRNGGYEP